jgi:hypothetical protein
MYLCIWFLNFLDNNPPYTHSHVMTYYPWHYSLWFDEDHYTIDTTWHLHWENRYLRHMVYMWLIMGIWRYLHHMLVWTTHHHNMPTHRLLHHHTGSNYCSLSYYVITKQHLKPNIITVIVYVCDVYRRMLNQNRERVDQIDYWYHTHLWCQVCM